MRDAASSCLPWGFGLYKVYTIKDTAKLMPIKVIIKQAIGLTPHFFFNLKITNISLYKHIFSVISFRAAPHAYLRR